MTNHEVVEVGVRVAGAVLIVSQLGPVLQIVPASLHMATTQPYWLVAFAIPPLALLGLGLLMIAGPSAFAGLILPARTGSAETTDWSMEDLQAVLFSVLGVYFIVSTVTDLSGWVRVWSVSSGQANWPDASHLASVATVILRLGAGVCLLLGGRGLASLVGRLRSA